MQIDADSLRARLTGLESIGIREDGVWRLAWSEEDSACREWFAAQAREVGLRFERDPAGNLWACPQVDPPWPALGSHLDSVRGGGRFDGPLGVACAFEIATKARRPVAVVSFADEEGARFNAPTFGSKALAGRLDLPGVLERTDDAGTRLGDALRAAGVDPAGLREAPAWLDRLESFVEIHIDQTTELFRAGAPVGTVSSLAPRRRLEVELRGRADHAGTTPPAERRDALAAAARLMITADELGQALGLTVTTARIEVHPNAPTTIPARVRLWIDARGEGIDGWQEQMGRAAEGLRVEVSFTTASRSDAVSFDSGLRRELGRAAERLVGRSVPELVCLAGHDAGVLAARVPAAMVFVRNPTGISHAPEETVDLEDAAVAAQVVLEAI